MNLGPENYGGGRVAEEMYSLRAGARHESIGELPSLLGSPIPATMRATGDPDPMSRNGKSSPFDPPSLPSLALPSLHDHTPTANGLRSNTHAGELLADHPLLRGLLMELPTRGSTPPDGPWLDRWFEAARSILELLYSQSR